MDGTVSAYEGRGDAESGPGQDHGDTGTQGHELGLAREGTAVTPPLPWEK